MIPSSVYAWAIALLLGIGAVLGYGHYRYEAGDKVGSDRVQVTLDAFKADVQATADKAIAQATKDRDTALEANSVIKDQYETQVFSANAAAQQLANRLRNAEARLATSGSTPAKAGSGQSAAPAGPPPSNDRLTDLLGRTFEQCSQNADQLDALIAEIKPQL